MQLGGGCGMQITFSKGQLDPHPWGPHLDGCSEAWHRLRHPHVLCQGVLEGLLQRHQGGWKQAGLRQHQLQCIGHH